MDDDVRDALAKDRVIDITTTGRRTGEPRRIEIWFHRIDGRYFITGTPGHPRGWYANLVAHPAFTFHLKQSVRADLPATARPITDPAERERVLAAVLEGGWNRSRARDGQLAAWIAGSPLVEVTFD